MNIEKIYTFFLKHRIITTDSRKSKVGSLFFALKGENFDGNKFAEIAIENGCNYAIIDNIDYKIVRLFNKAKALQINLYELDKIEDYNLGTNILNLFRNLN